jgi:hypothetical protein
MTDRDEAAAGGAAAASITHERPTNQLSPKLKAGTGRGKGRFVGRHHVRDAGPARRSPPSAEPEPGLRDLAELARRHGVVALVERDNPDVCIAVVVTWDRVEELVPDFWYGEIDAKAVEVRR